MKVLVTGVDGQLGYDVLKECLLKGYEVLGTGRKDKDDLNYQKMDIVLDEQVNDVILKFKPDVVVHCAAWTNVDLAEDEEYRQVVMDTNEKGTENIAKACQKIDAKMIYISTDYVFNEENNKLLTPSLDINPLNVYGLSKALGEKAVINNLDKYFIVRISWVFGKNGKNFLKTMLKVGQNHDEVRVVNDQIGRPTYTKDLAKLLVEMAKTNKYGIYHATNEGEYISWYDLTVELYKQAGLNTLVRPVTTEEYGLTKAKRPSNSRLDTSKLKEMGFEQLPNYKEAINRFLKEIDYKMEKKDFQSQIKVSKCPIEGLYEIEPQVHGDDRGYFMETYSQRDMEYNGLTMNFVQDNESKSKKGVLRGLHFQKEFPQGKLVRVISGEVFDVAVDLRADSPTYGQWYGVLLTEENRKQFYIPEGFAHGFLVLSETAKFCYKCTDFYHPNDEAGLAWNDPSIGIKWPRLNGNYLGNAGAKGYFLDDGTPISLSEKDEKWLTLERTFKFKK